MSHPYTTLISAEQLRALLDAPAPQLRGLLDAPAPQLVIVDTSFDLADVGAGERSWRDGHVPGSHYLHLDHDLSGAKVGPDGAFKGRHPLPERGDFARTLARVGITPQTQVVALDRQGGMYAARAWWLLRWMGHGAVAVLDGGLAAWAEAGGRLGTDTPPASASPAPYPDRTPLAATLGAGALAARLGRVRLIDARAGERFRGEVEPLDAAAGHIPGALNRFFKDNLTADGHFKPAELLRTEFAPLLGGQGGSGVVHQCGSGVTACHNLLAMEHAGLTGSLLYPGSWSEWSADPARPIARG